MSAMFDNVRNWQYTDEATITDLTYFKQLSQVSTYLDLFDLIQRYFSVLLKDERHNPQTSSNILTCMSAPAIVGLFHPAAGRGAEHGIAITVMTMFKHVRGFSIHLQTWY